jgi:hypothetical protein
MRTSGTIYQNELSTLPLTYSVKETSMKEWIIIECTFDNQTLIFHYNESKDTVLVKSPYRLCFCSPTLYNKYYLNIRGIGESKLLVIPWLKFGDTNDGIAIPQLIEDIITRIPVNIVFETA